MSDVPRVRRELEGLLAGASGDDVVLRRETGARWLVLLTRAPAVHGPRPGSVPVTRAVIQRIFILADQGRLNHQEIASAAKINMARASEVLSIRKYHRAGLDAEEIAARLPRVSHRKISAVLAVLED